MANPARNSFRCGKGFVAGLIDGEGSLDIMVYPRTLYLGGGRKNPRLRRDWSVIYKYPRLRVEMADYGDMSELARLLDEKCLLSRGKYFLVRVVGGRCMRVLTILYPIMKNLTKRKIIENWIPLSAIRSTVLLNWSPIWEADRIELSQQFNHFPNLLFLC